MPEPQRRGGGRQHGRPQSADRRPRNRGRVDEEAQATVEGRQAVRELLRAGRRRVHQLLVADGVEAAGPMAEILELASAAGVTVRRVPREALGRRAATDAPQGVLAVCDPLPETDLEQLLEASGPVPALLVVLDGVTDPHNLGAVMRSALSAGATGLVIGRHRAAGIGPVVTKAAAGAAEWLPVATVPGIPAALVAARAAGVWTVGLDERAGASLWADFAVATEPVALVLGAEGGGLSRLARERCELLVSVPMAGPLASLNVAAAATLACFEVARRRAGGEAASGH